MRSVTAHIRRQTRRLLVSGGLLLLFGLLWPGVLLGRIMTFREGWMFFLLGGLLVVIGFILVVQALRRMTDPTRDPSVRNLSDHGNWREVALDIDADLQQPDCLRIGMPRKSLRISSAEASSPCASPVVMTCSWLIVPAEEPFSFQFFQLDEILWVFSHETLLDQSEFLGSSRCTMQLGDSRGRQTRFFLAGSDSKAFLRALTERRPEVLVSYDT